MINFLLNFIDQQKYLSKHQLKCIGTYEYC
jgi:hypothetical protein